MSELLDTLGINGKLLIAQAANFLILLLILRWAVYKPLLKMMRERRERIEFGLKGAEEADRRLAEIETVRNQKLADADQQALALIAEAEKGGQKRAQEIVGGAEDKADYLLKEAANIAKQREAEAMANVGRQAGILVKEALIKAVELDPSAVDEKLINEAVKVV